jgi:DNA-binding protein H-NS
MKGNEFAAMSTDELWSLHERVTSMLTRKIAEEKAKLEERLRRLQNSNGMMSPNRRRRPYPKVLPKYQNPKDPAETWSGRGKQPHWVQAQLKAGKKLEHFLLAQSKPAQKKSHAFDKGRSAALEYSRSESQWQGG